MYIYKSMYMYIQIQHTSLLHYTFSNYTICATLTSQSMKTLNYSNK